MSNDQEPKLMDHHYDGIKEYDNPLPNWWLMTFFGTIIFSFVYFVHYTVGGGHTQPQELADEMLKLPKSLGKVWSESQLKVLFEEKNINVAGAAVYSQKCASCHKADGKGLIGPNLTDNIWIHGSGSRLEVVNLVSKGVLEKGMPAWEVLLSEEELIQVSGYVYFMRGLSQ